MANDSVLENTYEGEMGAPFLVYNDDAADHDDDDDDDDDEDDEAIFLEH